VQEKKRKKALLDWEKFNKARDGFTADEAGAFKGMLGVITLGSKRLMDGEKLETIIRIAHWLNPDEDIKSDWPRKKQFSVHDDLSDLVSVLDHVLQASYWKPKHPELGFVALFTDGDGTYWFRVSRGFHTALNESLASLESLVDEVAETATAEQKEKVSLLVQEAVGLLQLSLLNSSSRIERPSSIARFSNLVIGRHDSRSAQTSQVFARRTSERSTSRVVRAYSSQSVTKYRYPPGFRRLATRCTKSWRMIRRL
jgi:hypothetical protein